MRALKLIVILAVLFNLTGCWSKIELNELTFIYGLFVDAGDEPGTVEVTISSPLPNRLLANTQAGSTGGSAYSSVSKTAGSITDAIILIQKDLSRRLEISHLKAIVIGKKYAEHNIEEMLSWLNRQPEVPLGTYIMASPLKAKDIVDLAPIFEQFPSQVLMNFSKLNLMFAETLRDCLIARASGVGYAMNYLSFGEKKETSEKGGTVKWAGISGLMLFNDARMTGTLDEKDSRALAWAAGSLAGKFALPLYTVEWNENGHKGKASGLFYKSTSSIKLHMTPEGPEFLIRMKGKASLTLMQDSAGLTAIELGPLITRLLEEKITEDTNRAIAKTKEYRTDVLQLGMQLEWHRPKEWAQLKEQWSDYYKNHVPVKVTTQISLEDLGTVK